VPDDSNVGKEGEGRRRRDNGVLKFLGNRNEGKKGGDLAGKKGWCGERKRGSEMPM